jgi:hypothetical protein
MTGQGIIPAIWLEFDKSGAIDAGVVAQLNALLDRPDIEDLVVMSHGWKNDKNDATKLYGTLWKHACDNFPPGKADKIVVAGVLWPAKAFRTDFDETALAAVGASGTLGVGGGGGADPDLPDPQFQLLLAEFADFIGPSASATVTAAREAAGGLTASASQALVQEGTAAVGMDPNSPDTELGSDADPLRKAQANATEAQSLLSNLALPQQLTLDPKVGRAMGLGDKVQGLVSGTRAGVGRFLNQLTYYEMKKRAGIVGESLATRALGKLSPARPIRLHLVGHSFGGRLVTAAANRLTPPARLELFSLTILQGAYSHNALALKIKPGLDGPFSSVVGKPTGPIVYTHTHNDLACTIAYAIASRLSRDIASAIGDANDEYGAMGANGPQKLAAGAAEPDCTAEPFKPMRAKINTFLADTFILKTATTDAHNNVDNATCGRLLAKTLLA